MLRATRPVRSYVFTFADGDVAPLTVPAEAAHHVKRVSIVKLDNVGGAGDTVAVSIGGTACASIDLNGSPAGTTAEDQTLGVVEIGKGEQIVVTPSVGAGNNAVRLYLDVVDA